MTGLNFLAGAAAVPITPLADHRRLRLFLGGYDGYRGRPTAGIHDDLYARSLLLTDSVTTLALVVLDLVGASHAHIAAIRRRAAASLGLPEDSVLVSCTHTHASPDLQGLWGGVSRDFAAYLRRQAIRSLLQARESLRRASLHAASAQVTGHSHNRRGWPETDNTLTILQARDAKNAIIFTLVNLAVHPTVTIAENLLVSRDFPGVLVDRLEEALGGVALFVNGDQGDANPSASGDFRAMEAYGEGLAREALDAVKQEQALSPPLSLRAGNLDVSLANPRLRLPPAPLLRAFFAATAALGRAGALRWLADRFPREERAFVFAGLALAAEHPLFVRRGSPYLRTRASHLRIGDELAGLAAPGEVLTRLGVRLRQRLSAPLTLFLGLTNDTLGYFVPSDEWMCGRNNNYEETVSLGPQAAPSLERTMLDLLEERAP